VRRKSLAADVAMFVFGAGVLLTYIVLIAERLGEVWG
jgi:hypothetical protein